MSRWRSASDAVFLAYGQCETISAFLVVCVTRGWVTCRAFVIHISLALTFARLYTTSSDLAVPAPIRLPHNP